MIPRSLVRMISAPSNSGSLKSIQHAKASSTWKEPLCVAIFLVDPEEDIPSPSTRERLRCLSQSVLSTKKPSSFSTKGGKKLFDQSTAPFYTRIEDTRPPSTPIFEWMKVSKTTNERSEEHT